jgi:fatty acyl-CoA reductase
VPLAGDCTEIGLGLSVTDRQTLEENVSVVFHAAATVRFDDPLKSAVLMNTRGTREIMMVARNMKNLKVSSINVCSKCGSDHPLLFKFFAAYMLYFKHEIYIVQ